MAKRGASKLAELVVRIIPVESETAPITTAGLMAQMDSGLVTGPELGRKLVGALLNEASKAPNKTLKLTKEHENCVARVMDHYLSKDPDAFKAVDARLFGEDGMKGDGGDA